MKKRISFLLTAAIAMSSCGSLSYTSSSGQKFDDGIYSKPETVDREKLEMNRQETSLLAEKTRTSEIYLEQTEAEPKQATSNSIILPENKSAVINFSGNVTSVSIIDDPFDRFYYDALPWTYYRPLTFRSAYWDPWYYSRYRNYYDPWYWGFSYDPWYAYDRWYYDSWYYNPWRYDPWYYDYWHWGYHHHHWHHHYHYCGWYGGWGSWGGGIHIHGSSRRDIYYGPRSTTGFAGSTSSHRGSSSTLAGSGRVPAGNRQGIGTSSSSSRRTSSYGSSISRSSSSTGRTFNSSSRRVSSASRSGVVSTARPSGKPSGSVAHGSSGRPGTSQVISGGRRSVQSYVGNSSSGSSSTVTRSSVYSGQSNYRRSAGSGSSYNGNSYYNRSSSYRSSSSSQSFNRESSFNSSSSSYGRSSSSMSSRSSSMSSSSGGSRSGYSGGSSSSSGGGSSSVRRR